MALKFNWPVPTIAGIERMNAALAVLGALSLWYFDSRAAALSCLFGGAVVIVNLFLLALLGRAMLAAFGRGGAAARAGVAVAPLKLLIMVGLILLILTRAPIEAAGFAIGVLTQLPAIFIETWRVSRPGRLKPRAFLKPDTPDPDAPAA